MFKGNTPVDKYICNIFCLGVFLCSCREILFLRYYSPLRIITDANQRLRENGLVEIRAFSLVRDEPS